MKKHLATTVIAGGALAAVVSLTGGVASAQYPVTTTTTAPPTTTTTVPGTTTTTVPGTTTTTVPGTTTTTAAPTTTTTVAGGTLPATTSTTVDDDDLAGEGIGRPSTGGGASGGTAAGGATRGSTAGRLVRTGSDADVPIKVGVGLIAAGGLAVLTVRKRRQDDTVTS